MGFRFLLDTDTLSSLVRSPRGPVRDRIAVEGEQAICTSIVVAAELQFGAAKSGAARLADHVSAILGAIDVLPLDRPAELHYADIRQQLERAGTPIGPNDLLIAAQARSLDLTVVTGNDREFGRVPRLRTANWMHGTG